MQSGRADRLITIEQPRRSVDPTYGTETIVWIPLLAEAGSPTVAVKFFAEIEDFLPSRSEGVTLGLQVARNQTRMRMRWRSDVTGDMRVTVHGLTSDQDVLYSIVGGPAQILGRMAMLEAVLERYSS